MPNGFISFTAGLLTMEHNMSPKKKKNNLLPRSHPGVRFQSLGNHETFLASGCGGPKKLSGKSMARCSRFERLEYGNPIPFFNIVYFSRGTLPTKNVGKRELLGHLDEKPDRTPWPSWMFGTAPPPRPAPSQPSRRYPPPQKFGCEAPVGMDVMSAPNLGAKGSGSGP